MTVEDDKWIGLGSSAGRIEFDDQTTDEVNILDANVGIGVTDPTEKLQVAGNIVPSDDLERNLGTSSLRFSYVYGIRHDSGGNSAVVESDLDIRFTINDSEKMRITSTGLGIGTDSPTDKLEVEDLSGNASIRVNSKNGSNAFLYLTEDAASKYGGMLKHIGDTNKFQIGTINNDSETAVMEMSRQSKSVLFYGRLYLTADTYNIDDTGDANPATYTLSPKTSYVELTCSDADTCDITMDEAGMIEGFEVTIVNVSANVCDFADTAGVSELTGAIALGQYDVLKLIYIGDRWVQSAPHTDN